MSERADRARTALALGISITHDEMAAIQRDHEDGPTVALVADDPLASSARADLAPELRRLFASSPDRVLAAAAGLHPSSSADLIATTLASNAVRVLITSNPDRLQPHSHSVLLEHGGAAEQRAIARTTDDAAALALLATATSEPVRTTTAANDATPSDTLQMLAGDPVPAVRAAVARRPSLDAGLLEALALDAEESVRASVASNRSAPAAALRSMADDPQLRVRTALAANTSAPVDVLDRLAADPRAQVRSRVAANASAAGQLLVALADDPEESVRLQVARNPELTHGATFDALVGRVPDSAIASNRSASTASLDRIAARTSLIGTGTSDAANDRTVLLALARNPSCSASVVERLAAWSMSAADDEAPADIRHNVAQRIAGSQAITAPAHRLLAAHPDVQIRRRLAQRIDRWAPPADVFEQLADDEALPVLEALAENPWTPRHLRGSLPPAPNPPKADRGSLRDLGVRDTIRGIGQIVRWVTSGDEVSARSPVRRRRRSPQP